MDYVQVLYHQRQQVGYDNNNTLVLTLNSMYTLGPDSAFGTEGLLLSYNLSDLVYTEVTSTSSSTAPSKVECGPLTTQLASRTQQISDMVKRDFSAYF